jgi:HTH-type transcriptional regulator, sugar sensing transcriptional regulator
MAETINLEEIGLTEGESKVYLSLLKIGPSTIGSIIKEAQVSNSKIYDILDRLNKKGLVGISSINNVRHFEAKDPSLITELISKKEENINKIKEDLPRLQEMYKYAEPIQEAEILQGTRGIKTFTEMILSKLETGDTFYIMGAPKESTEVLGAYFQEWHERRAKKGIKCRIIFNKEAEERAKQRKKTPLTEVRIMPSGIITPALIDIGKDYVTTILFGERPLCIVIKNKKIAESYMSYFNLLWKIAKE